MKTCFSIMPFADGFEDIDRIISDIVNEEAAAKDDVTAMLNCEFVLTPVPMPNLIIIGERVAYEGLKRGGTRGFEMTHCETDPKSLRELIEQFDRLFEESRREMQREGDSEVVNHLRKFYREIAPEDSVR